jgi:2'-5' RNA ligase
MQPVDQKNSQKAVRCFVALPLDEICSARLLRMQADLRRVLSNDAARALRLTKPHAFHLTLRFLGDVATQDIAPLQDALRQACEGQTSFALHLNGIGCFPHTRQPRVVWAGVGGDMDALRVLQSRVTQHTASFGEPPETRAYRPHLTLARVNAAHRQVAHQVGQAVEQLTQATTADAETPWRASEVQLIQSELGREGSRYTLLAAFPLSAPGS